MTKVKFCGITRQKDALAAAQLGVHAIGLIFYKRSPRVVDITQAKEVIRDVPKSVARVGVFVDATSEEITSVLAQMSLDWLQFHGEEAPAFCRSFQVPYVKVVRMTSAIDLTIFCEHYFDAKALLLDTYLEHTPGGTGRTFAWELVPKNLSKPIILAGGLTPRNVEEAIDQVHPDMVDVVSGIEIAPGIKDYDKMVEFIAASKRK